MLLSCKSSGISSRRFNGGQFTKKVMVWDSKEVVSGRIKEVVVLTGFSDKMMTDQLFGPQKNRNNAVVVLTGILDKKMTNEGWYSLATESGS